MTAMKAQITLPADLDQMLQERIRQEVVRVLSEAKPQPAPRKLNIGQAAAYAGVARNTLKKWIANGLSVQVIGGVKRISTSDLDRYMDGNN